MPLGVSSGGSERQIEDAAGILRVRADDLDLIYLRRWVGELELEDPWIRAVEHSGTDTRP